MKHRMRNTQAIIRRAQRRRMAQRNPNTAVVMEQTLQQHEASLVRAATLCAREFGEESPITQRARAAVTAVLDVMTALSIAPAWDLPDNVAALQLKQSMAQL